MRCKWFELSVRINGRWEHFESDNLISLLLNIRRNHKGKKVYGSLKINFPQQ